MEGEQENEVIEGRKAMIGNPVYRAPSESEIESEPESENPCPRYAIPLKVKSESEPASETPTHYKLKTQGVSSSEKIPKYTKAAGGRSILLVAFIIIGSAAFVSMGISLWSISRVNSNISKLGMIMIELKAFKNNIYEKTKGEQIEFNIIKSNISKQIKELINNISEHSMEIQALTDQIMKLQASKNEEIMGLQVSNNDISKKIMELQISKNNLYHQIMELKNASDDTSNLKTIQLQNFSNAANELHNYFDLKINKIIQSEQYDSCSHVLQLNPSSPSDHYWIRSSNGSAVYVYCDFNRQCGCDGPSTWTRVAFLNMSDPNQVCPKNWTIFSNKVRRCSREKTTITGCNSVFHSTFGMTYSRVCGRIIGYQQSTTDGFQGLLVQGKSIDGQYVDGVSLTHGSVGSRQHIWSFASAIGEATRFKARYVCDCSNNNKWPYNTSFVGNDYFCDSGNHVTHYTPNKLYSRDPLWDGQGCGPSSTCCQFNTPPWFCKTLPQSTTDDLEVRICHGGNDEDTPIQLVELYVQ